MKPVFASVLLVAIAACSQAPYDPTDMRVPSPNSLIQGDPVLAPANCRLAPSRICQLETELRFTPPATNTPWKSKPFVVPTSPDGTTVGASIPAAVWGLIGLPYDPLFLRPAILHDHYTYTENLVRPWQETHRMFYYALREEGVDPLRALVMFYAVYAFGGHWTEILTGENCGPGCVRVAPEVTELIYYPPTIETDRAAREIRALYEALKREQEAGDTIETVRGGDPLARIEALAQARNPANIPFMGDGASRSTADLGDQFAADRTLGRAIVVDKPTPE